jgi:outer membrane murein-binding lipoprotein Lpp
MKIKIIAISSILSIALFAGSASVAKAVTIEELLAQIATLQAQIAALEAQANQQNQTQWCHTFSTYLVAGTNSEEVENLVGALSKENLFSTARGSYYNFDEDVAAAVVKFQGKYGITQTATVGPITRSKLNELYGCKSQPVACTMDVKLCPDGVTYVGRTGSNCEFKECPIRQNLQLPNIARSKSNIFTGGDHWHSLVYQTPTQPMDVSIINAKRPECGQFFQRLLHQMLCQSIVFFTSSSSVDKTYIAPGKYKARICISGTNDCVISDTYFTVTANIGPIVNLNINGTKSIGYQNPTVNLVKASQTTITWSSIGADHCSTYGQTKLKLTDGTTWNKTDLPTSGYAIFNTSGQVDGLGNEMFSASIGVQCWNADSSVSDSKGILVLWSTPPTNCPVVNCVWDPCPGGHAADENGCTNCSTACRPRL